MKQLLILSGKGGTGKTTVAGAFIKLLQAKSYADCDVDAPNLHLITKHNNVPIQKDYYGLPKAYIDENLCISCDLCKQNCRFNAIHCNEKYYIDEYACEGCGVCELICPAKAIAMHESVAGELMLYRNSAVFSTAKLKMGSGTSGKLVAQVKTQLRRATKNITLAIIDGSPGIGCPVIASLSGVYMALIVAEPSISGISDMERVIKTAKHFGTKIAVCVNKCDTATKMTAEIQEYCIKNSISFVGKIPYDGKAVDAINQGISIVELDCLSGIAVKEVFANTMKIMI